MQATPYQHLLQRLDDFIRRYYKNQLVKGALFTVAIILSAYLFVVVFGYYSYFSSTIRTVLFYSFLLTNVIILRKYILLPILSYFRLGAVINHETAANIIGKHFPEVEDKLLNILQLKQIHQSDSSTDLVEASINQKINKLQPIPFNNVIQFGENKKYLKYVIAPVCLLVILLFAAPSILSEGVKQVVYHNQVFEKPAPFEFTVLNDDLTALQNEDFKLELKLSGTEIPAEVFLELDGNRYKLDKQSNLRFSYDFKNLQKSANFNFYAVGFNSKTYQLKVLPKASILSFDVDIQYPAYTKKKSEKLRNTGDLTIPAGTVVNWVFTATNSDKISVQLYNELTDATQTTANRFVYSNRLVKSSEFSVYPINNLVNDPEQANYFITVLPDKYPTIEVIERKDSVRSKLLYFTGYVTDDYGFSRLNLVYQLNKENAKPVTIPLNVNKDGSEERFFHYWDLNETNLEPGDEITYYFEIWDNDGISGAKSSRSALFSIKTPSLSELTKQTEINSNVLKQKMADAMKKASEIEREAQRIQEKLLEKKDLSFEDRKQIEQLVNKQKQLEQMVQEIAKENERNQLNNNEFNEFNERIAEKQNQLKNLFDNILDEKTKELIERLQKLLEENNKSLTQEELEKLKLNNNTLEKELDRMLELYKQLEFDQQMQQAIDRLDELAKKQEELADLAKDKTTDLDKLAEEQKKLNDEFNAIKEQLKDLEQKNQDLANPNGFQNPVEKQEEIDKQMKEGLKNLDKKDNGKASQDQRGAAQKMQELAKQLQEMQEEMEGEQLDINSRALREILENLLKVSFNQERIMQELRNTSTNDPKYIELTRKQNALIEDVKMVQDSLLSLSARIPQIESAVNKEIAEIAANLERVITSLADRRTGEANSRQQFVMTSVNNLAVLLTEILNQLQNAKMNAKGSGKSKQRQPSLSELSKMQEEINKRIEKLQQGVKPGEKPGREQSEEIARLAREQQALRNMLNKINQENNKDGKGSLGDLNKLGEEMEKTETDLFNKKLNRELLMRQQEILTRLLEADKAERERDLDDKRESKSGREFVPNYDLVFDEYKNLKNKEIELYKTLPAGLKPFFKSKINVYFEQLNNTKSINE